jgi:hypothetical protein
MAETMTGLGGFPVVTLAETRETALANKQLAYMSDV